MTPGGLQDQAAKAKGALWLLAAALLGTGLAVGLAPLIRLVPWRWEVQMGTMLAAMPEAPCRPSPAAQGAADRLLARLYPLAGDRPEQVITVRFVESAEVNAFATLGGKVYVTSALLRAAQSPDELAGVLAHEIGHVTRRHILEGTLKQALLQGFGLLGGGDGWPGLLNFYLTLDFSRAQEAEADREGLRRLQAAHVSNAGLRAFFARLGKDENTPLLSDHPGAAARQAMIDTFPNEATAPALDEATWQALRDACAPPAW